MKTALERASLQDFQRKDIDRAANEAYTYTYLTGLQVYKEKG